MSTEIICYPDNIEFGGSTWIKSTTSDGRPRFTTYVKERGDARISQYELDGGYNSGRWYWCADLRAKLIDVNLLTLDKEASGIEDTYELAMMSALDAEWMLLADIGALLCALSPRSVYAEGFSAGQEDIAAKIREVIQ